MLPDPEAIRNNFFKNLKQRLSNAQKDNLQTVINIQYYETHIMIVASFRYTVALDGRRRFQPFLIFVCRNILFKIYLKRIEFLNI